MEVVEILRTHAKKISAAIFSVGVGVSAAAGFASIDDVADVREDLDIIDSQDEQVSDIDSQIDEQKKKLETVAASTNNEVKYTRLGC